MRVPKWLVPGIGIALVIAVLSTVWWLLVRTDDTRVSSGRPSPTSSTADESTNVQAVQTLIRDLPKAFAERDPSVLSSAARQRGLDLRAALPPGVTLQPEPSTWRRTGAIGSMTANANIAGQPPVRFVVVVIHENASWKVSSTYQIGAS